MLSAVGVAIASFGDTLGVLFASRLASGATAAAIIPLSMAYIGDVVPYHNRQAVLARFLSGQILGVISGQVFGGVFGGILGWRGLFLVLGGLYLIVALLLWTEFRSGRVVRHRSSGGRFRALPQQYRAILRSPKARTVLATVFA